MIGQIGPLVQGAGQRAQVTLPHLAGGIVGGAVAGVALGWAGTAVRAVTGQPSWTVGASSTLAAICAVAGLADVGILRVELFRGKNRQTPKNWQCALGVPGASFAWGVDLALAVTTRISYQALLVVPVAALLAPTFAAAVAVMATFGLTRAGVAVLGSLTTSDVDARTSAIDVHYQMFRRLAGAGSLMLAVVLAGAAVGAGG
jgi:hypothetical protein